MIFDLIVSQGRLADRKARTIEGAARIAEALECRYGVRGHFIGYAAPPSDDDWRLSLAQAKETLIGLGRAIAGSFESGNVPVMVANTCLASLPISSV